ncbi:MAG: beta-ketoacyl-ACP synthase [Neomegalonema sp.]|nr:beta-ketoacyl-ACP synthase [Neomegalonema sp.]
MTDKAKSRMTAYAMTSALGTGRAAHLAALRACSSGLTRRGFPDLPFDCPVGEVAGLDHLAFPAHLAEFDNRANRLTLAALQSDGFEARARDVIARCGAERVGTVVGTSTAGVEKLEQVYRALPEGAAMPPDFDMRYHNSHHAVGDFLSQYFAITGPSYTVSTACSSSAKALIDAAQLIEAGFCDAVIVGGVDSLCLTSLNGFEALQLVSRQPCRPCDAARDGLTIGEAAALILVERSEGAGARLSGYGESSDGEHMSTPPKDGAGARAAMLAALKMAGLGPAQIDYINMHGTATPLNDAAECAAIQAVFGGAVPASSLKGAFGHTLGAAGALEAALCLLAMEENLVPGTIGLKTVDADCACAFAGPSRPAPLRHVMSNAFGFGGNNSAIILSQ